MMDESQFNTLRELARDGAVSQRELSRRMGLSLGKVNYVVNALLEKGYIKAQRFKNSRNKMAYRYVLTPRGIATKMHQTYAFLQRKTAEYERLKVEIENLKNDASTERGEESGARREDEDGSLHFASEGLASKSRLEGE